jgi:hypothetical protein
MIGLDTRRRWAVMESKGRTNSFSQDLLVHAKSQTRNLRQISGNYPNLRVAAVTHFTNNFLTPDWEDPEGSNDDSFDLQTSLEEVSGFTIYTFQNVNLTIGLDTTIYNSYRNRTLEQYNDNK